MTDEFQLIPWVVGSMATAVSVLFGALLRSWYLRIQDLKQEAKEDQERISNLARALEECETNNHHKR